MVSRAFDGHTTRGIPTTGESYNIYLTFNPPLHLSRPCREHGSTSGLKFRLRGEWLTRDVKIQVQVRAER